MHGSKKNDPCIVTALEGARGAPALPLARPLLLPFQSWEPGLYLPWRSTAASASGTPALLWGASVPFPAESAAPGVALTPGLQDSKGSAATEQLCFKWPRAVWSFDPVQARRPRGRDFSAERPPCQLLLSRHQPCSQTLRGAPSEHLSVRLPSGLATPPLSQPHFSYFSFQDRTGGKGRVKWNQLLCANLQDLAQLWGL